MAPLVAFGARGGRFGRLSGQRLDRSGGEVGLLETVLGYRFVRGFGRGDLLMDGSASLYGLRERRSILVSIFMENSCLLQG